MGTCYEPFESAEEVWFWFCSSMVARNTGLRARGDYGGRERCCEINDIYRIIKRIKMRKHISNRHLRVLVKWGSMSVPPYYERRAKKSEIRLWSEAIGVLEFYFREKGIIL
jgi:hypothetical protein